MKRLNGTYSLSAFAAALVLAALALLLASCAARAPERSSGPEYVFSQDTTARGIEVMLLVRLEPVPAPPASPWGIALRRTFAAQTNVDSMMTLYRDAVARERAAIDSLVAGLVARQSSYALHERLSRSYFDNRERP